MSLQDLIDAAQAAGYEQDDFKHVGLYLPSERPFRGGIRFDCVVVDRFDDDGDCIMKRDEGQ